MKTRITSVYVVCLFVILSSAAGSFEPALDSEGEQIRAGVEYVVSSFNWDPNGVGLTLASVSNKPCPLDVIRSGKGDPLYGLPMTFHPEEGELVYLSSDINIKFNVSTACSESTVWKVVRDDATEGGVVSTGGVVGKESWFKMESSGLLNFYYLRHCPRDGGPCRNIGIDSYMRLFEHDQGDEILGFVFVIVKASLLPSAT